MRGTRLGLDPGAERRLQADVGEEAVVGAVRATVGRALGAVVVTLDAQGIIRDADVGGIVAAGRDEAEVPRVEQAPPFQARQPRLALARAVRPAERAQPGLARIALFVVPRTSFPFGCCRMIPPARLPREMSLSTPKRPRRSRLSGFSLGPGADLLVERPARMGENHR